MKPLKKKFQYGNHEVILETGQIARQANGAVLVNMEGTVVLTTVVAKNDGKPADGKTGGPEQSTKWGL